MSRILFLILSAAIERTLSVFGLDAHVQPDTSGLGFWAFERKQAGPLDAEYWGFGLHVAVSRPRLNRSRRLSR